MIFVSFGIYAAQQPSFTPSLVPLTDGIYNLGSTSPSNLRWNNLYVMNAYLYGLSDGCLSTVSNKITSTGVACGSGSGGGGGISDPFTHPSAGKSATTSEMQITGGLLSTASTTISAPLMLSSLTQGFAGIGSSGLVYPIASSSINLSSLNNDLANLTATNGTLTFSGSYNGSVARTVGLNLGNTNTWTILQNFNFSSTTGSASFANASSTTWTGGGLATCSGSNFLQYSATNFFGCATAGGGTFPFTSVAGYNSTSTTIGFLNGLFSTASSTFSSSLFLPSLTQGNIYTGSNGLVQTQATSSIASGVGITVTNGSTAYVLGAQPFVACNTASASVFGCLSASDFSKFNSATTTFTSPLTYTAGTNAVTLSTVPVSKGGTNQTSYPINSIITSDALGTSLIATGTQLTVGNILATTTAVNTFNGVIVAPDGTLSNPAFSFADDQNNGIYSPANDILAFLTNGIERFRINDSSGYSSFGTTTEGISILTLGTSTAPQLALSTNTGGIAQWTFANEGGNLYLSTTTVAGTATTSTAALSLIGNGKPSIAISSSTPNATLTVESRGGDFNYIMYVGSTTAPAMYIDSGKLLYLPSLNTSTAGNAVCVLTGGNVVTAGGATCATSSKFTKDFIDSMTFEQAQSIVERMNAIIFKYKDSGVEHFGFYAEEVEKFEPRLVEHAKEDFTLDGHFFKKGEPISVDYAGYTAVLTKYLQGKPGSTSSHSIALEIVVGVLILYMIYNEISKRRT